jgi:hypothetical protein
VRRGGKGSLLLGNFIDKVHRDPQGKIPRLAQVVGDIVNDLLFGPSLVVFNGRLVVAWMGTDLRLNGGVLPVS